jgi:hypothetical protein
MMKMKMIKYDACSACLLAEAAFGMHARPYGPIEEYYSSRIALNYFHSVIKEVLELLTMITH